MVLEENKMGRDMENRFKWEKDKLIQIAFKLHRDNDKDVIEYLNTKTNKRAYLIDLIRKDMNETN